jgi:hypothetical protein
LLFWFLIFEELTNNKQRCWTLRERSPYFLSRFRFLRGVLAGLKDINFPCIVFWIHSPTQDSHNTPLGSLASPRVPPATFYLVEEKENNWIQPTFHFFFCFLSPFLSGSSSGDIYVFGANKDIQYTQIIRSHTKPITVLASDPNVSNCWASADFEGSIIVWRDFVKVQQFSEGK